MLKADAKDQASLKVEDEARISERFRLKAKNEEQASLKAQE